MQISASFNYFTNIQWNLPDSPGDVHLRLWQPSSPPPPRPPPCNQTLWAPQGQSWPTKGAHTGLAGVEVLASVCTGRSRSLSTQGTQRLTWSGRGRPSQTGPWSPRQCSRVIAIEKDDFAHPAHESGDQVVDDVAAEEERVDEPTVLVAKRLHSHSRLCWIRSCEIKMIIRPR